MQVQGDCQYHLLLLAEPIPETVHPAEGRKQRLYLPPNRLLKSRLPMVKKQMCSLPRCHQQLHHRLQELAVQRLSERRQGQRRCLQHHRDGQGQRPEPLSEPQVPLLAPAERRYFQRIHDGEASPVEMEEALRRLMNMMKRYHHQPVVLLLDEYDIPVQQAWEHGFYEECMAFMRNFLSAALKTNPSLDFAVLTGCGLRKRASSAVSTILRSAASSMGHMRIGSALRQKRCDRWLITAYCWA